MERNNTKFMFFHYGGGWWMRVTSFCQLMVVLENDQTSVVSATKKLLKFYDGEADKEESLHKESDLANCLDILHQHSGNSLLSDISSLVGATTAAKIKAFSEKGFLNINCMGGWNYCDWPIENAVIKDVPVFPHQSIKDIRIETMAPAEKKYAGAIRPGYNYHYYAYIGKTQVVIGDKTKWSTEKEAYSAALQFLGTM